MIVIIYFNIKLLRAKLALYLTVIFFVLHDIYCLYYISTKNDFKSTPLKTSLNQIEKFLEKKKIKKKAIRFL